MTKSELLYEIKEVLQRDEELSLEMELDNIEEWDSLAIISMISLYDQLGGGVVTAARLKKCETVNDLVELIAHKLDS